MSRRVSRVHMLIVIDGPSHSKVVFGRKMDVHHMKEWNDHDFILSLSGFQVPISQCQQPIFFERHALLTFKFMFHKSHRVVGFLCSHLLYTRAETGDG